MEKYEELMRHSKKELCAKLLAMSEVYDELWQRYMDLIKKYGEAQADAHFTEKFNEEAKPRSERKVFYLHKK